MKSLSLILVGVLCAYSNAETIIGEFSGKLDTTFIFADGTIAFLQEVGANHGDLVFGEFTYQSDAEVSGEFEGKSRYAAEHIWVQIGDRRIEHDDLVVSVAPGGRTAGIFAVQHGSEFIPGVTSPVEFVMFGSEDGSPVFSHDLPLSTKDINLEIPWRVAIPTDKSLRTLFNLTDKSLEIGPACNPNTLGDLNADGEVRFDDFLVLSANFGEDLSEVSPVPEPNLSCALYAFFCSLVHHRHGRL